MKPIITFCFVLLGFVKIYAQGHPDLLSGEARDLYQKGIKCWTQGGDDCISYFQKAYVLVKNQGAGCTGCIEVELAKSYSYMEKFDSAQQYLNKARLSLNKMEYKDVRVKQLDAEIQNSTSLNFYYMEKVDSAIFYLKKNIEIIDLIGNKKSSAFAKMNLASIFSTVNDFPSAIQYSLRAFDELKALNELEDSRVAILAGNLATFYHETGDIQSSILWARRAIQWGQKSQSVTAQTYGNYVLAAGLSKSQPDSALIYIDRAVDFAEKSGREAYIAKSKSTKGFILSQMKRYVSAEKTLLEAADLQKENPQSRDYLNTLYNLALVTFENGNYKHSAAYFKDYVLKNDSSSMARNQELVHEINIKYETEKKEKQIAEQELEIQRQRSNLLYAILGGALLTSVLGGFFIYNRKSQQLKWKQLQQEKENAILNSFISGEERERNRISHELHDGVAAMIGAAKMSLEAIPHLPQDKRMEQLAKVQGILEHSHADIRHIAHNLLPTVLEKEGLIQATIQFISEINETNLVNISVRDKTDKVNEYSQQLQLMLFRVIQELVNNIIRHSQALNGEIVFSKFQNALVIEVTDDGIGYADSAAQTNQGLYSIRQRLKSIGGNFEIYGGDHGGTHAKVELAV